MTDLLIHRGIVNKNYKENLLKSFKQSFKKGYGIETDIHATKDNKFICFHDFTLNRIFRKNVSVKNLNYSKIKEISSKNKRTIPLLKDLLKTSKNKYLLFIELKPAFSKKLLQKLLKETSNNKQIDYLILDKSFLKNKNIQNLKIKKYYYTIKTKSEFNKYNKKNNLIFENL